jgi:hypothetical protein
VGNLAVIVYERQDPPEYRSADRPWLGPLARETDLRTVE